METGSRLQVAWGWEQEGEAGTKDLMGDARNVLKLEYGDGSTTQ